MVYEAEHNAEVNEAPQKEEEEMNTYDYQNVQEAVRCWIAAGKHLKNGITVQQAADEMKLPRYQLTSWLKTVEHEQFSTWLTHLRVEEAKRQIQLHPEWSNDVIAEHCGFGSRTYFQTVFRKQTGMTPSTYLEEVKTKR